MARHHRIGISILVWVLAAAIAAGDHSLWAAEKPLAPKQILHVQPSLTDDKEAENISGAACAFVNDKGSSCLLIGDEKKCARFFTLEGDTLVPGTQLFLLPNAYKDGQQTREFDETDAEGIAFSNGNVLPDRLTRAEQKWRPSGLAVFHLPRQRESGHRARS